MSFPSVHWLPAQWPPYTVPARLASIYVFGAESTPPWALKHSLALVVMGDPPSPYLAMPLGKQIWSWELSKHWLSPVQKHAARLQEHHKKFHVEIRDRIRAKIHIQIRMEFSSIGPRRKRKFKRCILTTQFSIARWHTCQNFASSYMHVQNVQPNKGEQLCAKLTESDTFNNKLVLDIRPSMFRFAWCLFLAQAKMFMAWQLCSDKLLPKQHIMPKISSLWSKRLQNGRLNPRGHKSNLTSFTQKSEEWTRKGWPLRRKLSTTRPKHRARLQRIATTLTNEMHKLQYTKLRPKEPKKAQHNKNTGLQNKLNLQAWPTDARELQPQWRFMLCLGRLLLPISVAQLNSSAMMPSRWCMAAWSQTWTLISHRLQVPKSAEKIRSQPQRQWNPQDPIGFTRVIVDLCKEC